MNESELERLLRTPERRVRLAPFSAVEARARRRSPGLVPAVAAVAAIIVGVVAGVRLADLRQQRAADPSPAPGLSASPSTSPSATASTTAPPRGPVTHENLVLGYRITLPEGYRRSISRIDTAPGQRAGLDYYTLKTEREAREECERDGSHVGGGSLESDVRVAVSLEIGGMSARDWATTPRVSGGQPLSQHRRVEPVTIGAHDAVRLVWEQTGEIAMFVIRANDRIYELGPTVSSLPSGLPSGWLDDIVRSFTARQPPPFPTSTPPPQPPRDAAQRLAVELAAAFAARDADTVARVMPECWVVGSYLVDGEQPGMGGINRSVVLFTRGLRERFARGDLTVSVEPTVETDTRTFGGYYVRSQWREPDLTIRVDLGLAERDGRWIWWAFLHHFSRADLAGGPCAPLRSPWVDGTC